MFGRKKRDVLEKIHEVQDDTLYIDYHMSPEEVSKRVKRQALVCNPEADIILVVDSSGSIEFNNPGDYELEKRFIIDVINSLGALGPRGIQIGLVLFSDQVQNIFYLNTYQDKGQMINAVQNMPYIEQQTDIALAFENVRDRQLIPSRGDRPEAPNVAIIITDGKQEPVGRDVIGIVSSVRRDRQLSVFAVGVGPFIDTFELQGVSGVLQGDGSFLQQEGVSWFRSPDFTQVSGLVQGIVTEVCEAVPTPPPPTADNLYCRKTCDGYYCWCISQNPIFSVNGTRCVDYDECQVNNGGCEDRCDNLPGSYRCSCSAGLRLGTNNHECEDIDECAEQPGRCVFGSTCVNTWGGYSCISGVFREGAVAAANTGIETISATSASNGSMTALIAVSASVLNLVVLTVIGVVCVRRVRRKRAAKSPEKSNAKQGQSNGAFRTEAGTLRSFNSLSSKFTPTDTDADSISTSSSLSTIS